MSHVADMNRFRTDSVSSATILHTLITLIKNTLQARQGRVSRPDSHPHYRPDSHPYHRPDSHPYHRPDSHPYHRSHPYHKPDSHPYHRSRPHYRPDFQHMNDLLGEYDELVGETYNPPTEDRELLAVLQNIAADNPNTNRQGELISAIWLLFHSMTLTGRAVKQLHRTVAHWPVLAMAAPRYHDVRTANWYPDFRDWFERLHWAQQREYLDAIGRQQPHLP